MKSPVCVTNARRGLYRAHLKNMLLANPAEPMLAFWRAVGLASLGAVEWQGPILDLGCGDGSVTESLLGSKRVLLGIDIDPGVLIHALRRKIYAATACASALHLPVADETFATVFANCVLEHISEDAKVVREMARVLRKRGHLVVSVPSDLLPLRLWRVKYWLRRKAPEKANEYRKAFDKRFVHHHYHSVEEWRHLVQTSGLRLVVVRRYLPPFAQSFWERGQMFLEQTRCGRLLHRALGSPKLMRLFPLRARVTILWLIFAPLVLLAARQADKGSCLLLVAQKDIA